MTRQERANEIAAQFISLTDDKMEQLAGDIHDALDAVAAEENEACANLAERVRWNVIRRDAGTSIAAAIRRRAKQEKGK